MSNWTSAAITLMGSWVDCGEGQKRHLYHRLSVSDVLRKQQERISHLQLDPIFKRQRVLMV